MRDTTRAPQHLLVLPDLPCQFLNKRGIGHGSGKQIRAAFVAQLAVKENELSNDVSKESGDSEIIQVREQPANLIGCLSGQLVPFLSGRTSHGNDPVNG